MLKDGYNYGLFIPASHGRAGKFLSDDRCIKEYNILHASLLVVSSFGCGIAQLIDFGHVRQRCDLLGYKGSPRDTIRAPSRETRMPPPVFAEQLRRANYFSSPCTLHSTKIAFFCLPEVYRGPKICQKCVSGRGFAPDNAGEVTTFPADPLVGWTPFPDLTPLCHSSAFGAHHSRLDPRGPPPKPCAPSLLYAARCWALLARSNIWQHHSNATVYA